MTIKRYYKPPQHNSAWLFTSFKAIKKSDYFGFSPLPWSKPWLNNHSLTAVMMHIVKINCLGVVRSRGSFLEDDNDLTMIDHISEMNCIESSSVLTVFKSFIILLCLQIFMFRNIYHYYNNKEVFFVSSFNS